MDELTVVLTHWTKFDGAELIVVGGDLLELRIEQPFDARRKEIAWGQFLTASDVVCDALTTCSDSPITAEAGLGLAYCGRAADCTLAVRSLITLVLAAAALNCRQRSVRPIETGPIKHVIVLTVDGLMPESYTDPDKHGLKVPMLRAMVASGAWSPGARSVYPSLTYPAHTTIVTERDPIDHGIHSNFAFDPEEKGGLFHDDVRDIRTRTVWDAAREAGLSTAIVNWPVAVGARVDVLLPEVWSNEPEDLEKEIAISTPGLFERVEKRFPGFLERVVQTEKAAAFTDIAVTVILEDRPALILVHIWDTDSHQHADGLWSPPALAAIENADQQIARLVDACKRAGIWETTVFVLLSDHGFAPISKQARPGVRFRQRTSLRLDPTASLPRGAPHSWERADKATSI